MSSFIISKDNIKKEVNKTMLDFYNHMVMVYKYEKEKNTGMIILLMNIYLILI